MGVVALLWIIGVLIPGIPHIATGPSDALMFRGVWPDTRTHPTRSAAPCESILVFDTSNKKTTADWALESLNVLAPAIGCYNPIKFDNSPFPVNVVTASGQFFSLKEGVFNLLHNPKASSGVGCGECKVNHAVAKLKIGISEEYIGALYGLGISFLAFDREPADDYQTISKKHDSNISEFGITYDTARQLIYLFIGLIISIFGIILAWFSENDLLRCKLINQMIQCVWAPVCLIGVLVMIAGL
jgi:hypothetical protein